MKKIPHVDLNVDYIESNRKFWNEWSHAEGPWSRKVSKDLIKKAQQGQLDIMPRTWQPKSWKGLDVLGLASAGGQQIPLLCATGAEVTSFDFSKEQLKKDREVCQKEGLKLKTCQGEMENLSVFKDKSFDFVLNGVSSCWTQDVKKVYREVFRVLKSQGVFVTEFTNPVCYSLDWRLYETKGEMKMIHKIPYSDLESLSAQEIKSKIKKGEHGFEFSHSLTDLIGGQTAAGFKITGLYETYWGKDEKEPLDSIIPQVISTRAIKG